MRNYQRWDWRASQDSFDDGSNKGVTGVLLLGAHDDQPTAKCFCTFQYFFGGMAIHQELGQRKSAYVQNEEALAFLVLSGRYLGFLSNHPARPFIKTGLMRELQNEVVTYTSNMSTIVCRSASKGRRLKTFLECLVSAHS